MRSSPSSVATAPISTARSGLWPLPAVLCWMLCFLLWALSLQALRHGSSGWAAAPWVTMHAPSLAWAMAAVAGVLFALRSCDGWWRRAIAAMGFPLLSVASGATMGLPAVAWLLPLLLLLLAYPLRSWRDAPIYPTPPLALEGLQNLLPAPQQVLDAGCGMGHGLQALRELWPRAQLHGLEWSPLWAWVAARRCPFAVVQRADMWRPGAWAAYEVVYLFQRPETMARAWEKAEQEMAAGSWLVSLEFEVPGQEPVAALEAPGKKPVWIYRTGSKAASPICGLTTGSVGR